VGSDARTWHWVGVRAGLRNLYVLVKLPLCAPKININQMHMEKK